MGTPDYAVKTLKALHLEGHDIAAVFCQPDKPVGRKQILIDKSGVVRHMVVNDMPLGRSVEEAIRMVDALQHFEQYGEVCPLGWQKGKEAMAPTHEGVSGYLSR